MSDNKCPFEKADKQEKRLKALFYGEPGTGKTITALQFPGVVVIDMERGTTSYGSDFDFHVIHATTPDEVKDAIDWLITNTHDFRTVVIDPITIYWSALQQKWSDIFLNRNKTGSGFKFEFYNMQMKDWNTLKAEGKALLRLLSRLDMNVIVTAHQKDLLEGDDLKKVGVTFDGMKGIDYFFDTVLRLYRKNESFKAVAIKDRTNLLPKGEFDMSYAVFEGGFGQAALSRKSEPIEFATPAQVDSLENWFVRFEMTPDQIKRFLSRECNGINELDEITKEQAETLEAKFQKKHNEIKEKENAEG